MKESKINNIVIDALNGKEIDNSLIWNAVNEVMSEIDGNRINEGISDPNNTDMNMVVDKDYSISAKNDVNGNIEIQIKTPDEKVPMVAEILDSDVKDKIRDCIMSAIGYARKNGAIFKVLKRILGDDSHLKDCADPMLMLIKQSGNDGELITIFDKIADLEENEELKDDNKTLLHFYKDLSSFDLNPGIIAGLNSSEFRSLWTPLVDKLSMANSIRKSMSISGPGEFGIAAVCSDLTMDTDGLTPKSNDSKTTPDLTKEGSRSNLGLVEVKKCNVIIDFADVNSTVVTQLCKHTGSRISFKSLAATERTNSDAVIQSIKNYFSNKGKILVISKNSQGYFVHGIYDSSSAVEVVTLDEDPTGLTNEEYPVIIIKPSNIVKDIDNKYPCNNPAIAITYDTASNAWRITAINDIR